MNIVRNNHIDGSDNVPADLARIGLVGNQPNQPRAVPIFYKNDLGTMLHHDVSHYQRHAKPTASWDHIALNQAHFYEQEIVTLDSSRDSVIEINQVHEQGPLDDAPPAPADPPSTPENPNERVTYGATDIRYKTKPAKRTDRTPSTCSSTSSSDAPWTPSYTRGRGRGPFVRGGARG